MTATLDTAPIRVSLPYSWWFLISKNCSRKFKLCPKTLQPLSKAPCQRRAVQQGGKLDHKRGPRSERTAGHPSAPAPWGLIDERISTRTAQTRGRDLARSESQGVLAYSDQPKARPGKIKLTWKIGLCHCWLEDNGKQPRPASCDVIVQCGCRGSLTLHHLGNWGTP